MVWCQVSGGPVVRWSGGPVVRWSGGPVCGVRCPVSGVRRPVRENRAIVGRGSWKASRNDDTLRTCNSGGFVEVVVMNVSEVVVLNILTLSGFFCCKEDVAFPGSKWVFVF